MTVTGRVASTTYTGFLASTTVTGLAPSALNALSRLSLNPTGIEGISSIALPNETDSLA